MKKMFFESYNHFYYSLKKKARELAGNKIFLNNDKLADIYKYDILFNPPHSISSSLYFGIFYAESLTQRELVDTIDNIHSQVLPYKETELWKESDIKPVHAATLTDEASAMRDNMVNRYGLYFLYGENKDLIYVGKSTASLNTRSLLSAKAKRARYIRYAFPESKADTTVYELFYISKHKPLFNKDSKHNDTLSLQLPELELTDFVRLYKEAN